jgi:cytochrome c oxidase subunit 2
MNVLDPAGPYARDVAGLWWLFFGVCAAVYALVVAFLATGALRRAPVPTDERRLGVAVGVAVAATVVALFVLAGASFWTGRALSAVRTSENPVRIHVTARQWWWEARYEAPTPAQLVRTANELHVPVGRPVELTLTSVDVIHSFWVPRLQGKRDLIPGHTTTLVLEADRPGVYRGQCAEFCGIQHARMAFEVVAEAPDAFDAWLARQRLPAATPRTPEQARGRQVFLAAKCPACHRLGGEPALALVGPDLTHLASRRTIAAGTLPNTRGHRAGWIVDPQGVKPGTRMPGNPLPPDDLQALLAYLDGLE